MNTPFMTYKEENEQLRARVLELEAIVNRNIDDGIDKIMTMTDEQISALAGFEGRNPGNQETIARKCFEVAQLNVRIAELEKERDAAREEIAAQQLVIQQMREALQMLDHVSNVSCGKVQEALALQPSTAALPELIEKVEKRTIDLCAEKLLSIGALGDGDFLAAIRAIPTGQIKLEELL